MPRTALTPEQEQKRADILTRAARDFDPHSRPEHPKVRSLLSILRSLPGEHIRGVEVGTYAAVTSSYLLAHEPRLHLTCIDPWVIPANHRYDEHLGLSRIDLRAVSEIARRRLMQFRRRVKIVQDVSLQAVKHFSDGSCDFVFLDGDKRRLADDIAAWLVKVSSGGVLCGHGCNSRVLSGQLPLAEAAAGWHGTAVETYNGRVWAIRKP